MADQSTIPIEGPARHGRLKGASGGRALASVLTGMVVLAVGGLLYLWWDGWFVNWDGGFYLYLARSMRDGNGLVFPDGTPANFRGPGYPALFSLGWTVVDVSAKTAIWMSRSVILGTGAVVGWLLARRGAHAIPAVIGGLSAIVPSIVLDSGAWYFVPDGMAIALVVLAVTAVAAGDEAPGLVRGILAGLAVAAAVLTKETAILYAPLIPMLIWTRTREGWPRSIQALGGFVIAITVAVSPWVFWAVSVGQVEHRFIPLSAPTLAMLIVSSLAVGVAVVVYGPRVRRRFKRLSMGALALAALPVSFIGTAAALWAFGEPTVTSAVGGVQPSADAVAAALGWSWLGVLVLVVTALALVRVVDRSTQPIWLAGSSLLAVGLGQIWYSGAAALNLRNGVGAVVGSAMLIGVTLAVCFRIPGPLGRWLLRPLSVALGLAVLLVAGYQTSYIDSARALDANSWDNPAVIEIETWLADAPFPSVTVMPMFANYIYFLGDRLPEPSLLSFFTASRGLEQYQTRDLCTMTWWAGDLSVCPPEEMAQVIQGNRRIVASLFAGSVPVDQPLVVTGITESGTAQNGTGLFYFIEKHGLGQRLFATSESSLPYWGVVYKLDRDRWSAGSFPAVVQTDLMGVDALVEGSIPIDREEFLDLLTEVLPP